MESTNTQATASKVSLLMLGQQAVIDAYLCLLHLTTGHPQAPTWLDPRSAALHLQHHRSMHVQLRLIQSMMVSVDVHY